MTVELAVSVHRYLLFLDSSDRMLEWVRNNPQKTEQFIRFYDSCVNWLNRVPTDNPLMQIMPATSLMRSVMGDIPLPLSTEYQGFTGLRTLFKGIKRAMGPMMLGQDIKKGKYDQVPIELKKYGIMTPSLPTTDDALTFGTVGHILERSFFSWAEARGIKPEAGWVKDDFLHTINEAVMVYLATGLAEGTCTDYFIRTPEDGGLGWIKSGAADNFERDLWGIYCR